MLWDNRDPKRGDAYDYCPCGNPKWKISKKCHVCANKKEDGSFAKKPDLEKRFFERGYVRIYKPEHHRANKLGYISEHTLIAEQKIGRELFDYEVVHHIDKNRANNNPNNLMVLTDGEHNKIHAKGRNPMYYGKYLTHKHNYCKCGKLKDTRAILCRSCAQKKRWITKRGTDDKQA